MSTTGRSTSPGSHYAATGTEDQITPAGLSSCRPLATKRVKIQEVPRSSDCSQRRCKLSKGQLAWAGLTTPGKRMTGRLRAHSCPLEGMRRGNGDRRIHREAKECCGKAGRAGKSKYVNASAGGRVAPVGACWETCRYRKVGRAAAVVREEEWAAAGLRSLCGLLASSM